MEKNLNLLLTLLGFVTLTIGCIAIGAKQTAKQSNVPSGNNTNPTHDDKSFTGKCLPKILRDDRDDNSNPYYHYYLIDTTEQATCKNTQKVEDLFGTNKLFPYSKYDSLVLTETSSVNKVKGAKSEYYQQYYKGIKVEGGNIALHSDNNKIFRIAGTFYPNIDIDTTGMISREEAAQIAFDNANVYPQFKDRFNIKGIAARGNFGVLPKYNKIFYSFEFNKLSQKPGTYIVNAVTGKFHSYVPADYLRYELTDCYQCNGNNSVLLQCEDTCAVNTCNTMDEIRTKLDTLMKITNQQKIQMIVRIGKSEKPFVSYRRHLNNLTKG